MKLKKHPDSYLFNPHTIESTTDKIVTLSLFIIIFGGMFFMWSYLVFCDWWDLVKSLI